MARGRTSTVMSARLAGSDRRAIQPDDLVVEEPMEIRLDDHLVTVTMRTPGNDYELAVGFCFTEGVLAGTAVRTVRYCATGGAVETNFNVVTVSTGGDAPIPESRLRSTTSSCGVCGSASLDLLLERLQPLDGPTPPIDVATLGRVAAEVRTRQPLFERTGSIHAAAGFDPSTGEVDAVREDIGRHNAVDKLVGHLLLSGNLPAHGRGLFVSGRASFEIVQKAWAAGFGLVAAVSGPSSLAVATARAANLALVGFVRGSAAGPVSATLYSPEPQPA